MKDLDLAARMKTRKRIVRAGTFLAVLALAPVLGGCGGSPAPQGTDVADGADPPEVQLGERLFVETRFAQVFAANASGDVNAPLQTGDPTLDVLVTSGAPLPGPFSGATINCRQCHLVDEADGVQGGGIRTYGDFAPRSAIPARLDGLVTAPRNSPPLVNASLDRTGPFVLHFDGEFESIEALVVGTLTGRNYGWLANERSAARAHIARIIREDDGRGPIAADFGGLSYAEVLKSSPTVRAPWRLPADLRLDVEVASDDSIIEVVARLIAIYVKQLEFARNEAGEFVGSPFDLFLARNGLPRQPDAGETPLAYARRLRASLGHLSPPQFITPADGTFIHHAQPFVFGATELAGLTTFLAEPSTMPPSPAEIAQGTIGNCIACHQPPVFTDFAFHNVGVSQAAFDSLHGPGAFSNLPIPDLAARSLAPSQWLPPTAENPIAASVFRSVPSLSDPAATDLGLWNVFANPALPGPQAALTSIVQEVFSLPATTTDPARLLPMTVALFKTPNLRDLGHGAPYFHDGSKETLDDVVQHYRVFSPLARAKQVRNADPRLQGIALNAGDVAPLIAFLQSLNEDYE